MSNVERLLTIAQAAERLRLTVPGLVALMRRYRYSWTELSAGGRPGDRGRNRWGLTESQLAAIVRGQERGFREPEPAKEAPRASAASPDGVSRLRRGKGR